jgi:hypothetical protein
VVEWVGCVCGWVIVHVPGVGGIGGWVGKGVVAVGCLSACLQMFDVGFILLEPQCSVNAWPGSGNKLQSSPVLVCGNFATSPASDRKP